MGLIARIKLLVLSTALLAGCFVQGTVTIFLLSGAASLLGSESPVFNVLAGIWIIGMIALMIWFIRWLVVTLGRRIDRVVDKAAERIIDRVGLGSGRDDHEAPETRDNNAAAQQVQPAPILAELDARLAQRPSAAAPKRPGPGRNKPTKARSPHSGETDLANLSPDAALQQVSDFIASLFMWLAGAAIGSVAGIVLLTLFGPGARSLGAALLGIGIGFVGGFIAGFLTSHSVLTRAARVRWLRARLDDVVPTYCLLASALVAMLLAIRFARP